MEHTDLKSLFRNIELDENELQDCRETLYRSLQSAQQSPARFSDRCRELLRFPYLRYALPALLVATAVLVFLKMQRSPFDSVELERLQQFVARHGDHAILQQESEWMRDSDSILQRLNGLYVLSALGTGQENILASVQGLIEDPRAEFRRYYLDYLLTHADEAYYDLEYLELLFDREADPECRELLLELISLARLKQRSQPAFI